MILDPQCDRCGQPHSGIFRSCTDCLDLSGAEAYRQQQEEKAKASRQASLVADWRMLVPTSYRKTDWNDKRLSPVCCDLAKNWWPEWDAEARGLGIYGTTGVGKSRAAWAILTRLHFAGFSVLAVDAIAFAKAASSYNDNDKMTKYEARDLLRRARNVKVLLLDDIGKEPSSPRTASEMHDLLNHRERECLSTIWTSERTGDELAAMFEQGNASSYADGIIRRLRCGCKIYDATPTPNE